MPHKKDLQQWYYKDQAPIAYASKALTDTHTHYAQIEKETLAMMFGCKHFH